MILAQSHKVSLSEFFSQAGKFLSSYTQTLGDFPCRKFVAVFIHKKGVAKFDGKDWDCTLTAKVHQEELNNEL